MQSLFTFYLQLGLEHILDWEGYDHIAYVVALCAVFRPRDWRKTVLLITAFTVGHSVTLALAGLDIFQLTPQQKEVVEILIPLTIIATALLNILQAKQPGRIFWYTYALTAFFGLIHGLGFSTFFRSSLMPGDTQTLFQQLAAFNIGVELGQLVIVFFVTGTAAVLFRFTKLSPRSFSVFVSVLAVLCGVWLLFKP